MPACANHPEASAVAKCVRCQTVFCDPCVVFLVNDDPWCEPCGNGEIESGKGHPVLAIVVLLLGLAAFVALAYVQIYVVRRYNLYSTALILLPIAAAWRIAYPPTAGEKPRIVDRTRARRPIPIAKRMSGT